MGHFSPFKGRTGPAAAVSRAQISCPLWQQEVTSHRQEEGRSWQEMDDLLGAAFYRNTTSKCVYRLSSAEAFYKHNVDAALHQSERSEEGRGGKRRRRRKQQETRASFISPSFFSLRVFPPVSVALFTISLNVYHLLIGRSSFPGRALIELWLGKWKCVCVSTSFLFLFLHLIVLQLFLFKRHTKNAHRFISEKWL